MAAAIKCPKVRNRTARSRLGIVSTSQVEDASRLRDPKTLLRQRQADGLGTMVVLLSVPAANGSAPLVVLLVEDELVMRWSVADSLREAGFTVIEAASGYEATAICRSGVPLHLLFTDINLLGSDTGLDVADYFRTHRPEVPVLYTSGKEIDAARRVDGSEFLSKPYQLENAVSACRRLCTK